MTIKRPQRTFVKPCDLQPSHGGHHHSDSEWQQCLHARFHSTRGRHLTLSNFLCDCWEAEMWEEPAESRGSDFEMKMVDDSSPPFPPLHRRPRGWGVVTVEHVFPHVWPRLASEDALLRLLSLWDPVQRCPAGNAHMQQHLFLSRWTWNRGLRYMLILIF